MITLPTTERGETSSNSSRNLSRKPIDDLGQLVRRFGRFRRYKTQEPVFSAEVPAHQSLLWLHHGSSADRARTERRATDETRSDGFYQEAVIGCHRGNSIF